MPMNPAVQAVIKAITRLQPDVANSWNSQRKVEDAAGKLTIADPRCRIDKITATADDGYEIPLRVFTPLDIDFSLKRGLHVNEDHRGTILYLHGGGWANGDVEFYSDACMRTALKLERRVIAVDYRRSPEHRFPTALEDCYAVARQLFAGTLIRDADPGRIVLMGDSAGGNLTAAVSLLARERGDFRPRTQILLYPLVYNDHSETTLFDSTTARTTFSPARPSSTTSNCTCARPPISTTPASHRSSRRRWPTCPARSSSPPSTTLCATRARLSLRAWMRRATKWPASA